MSAFVASPLFCITLTLLAYVGFEKLYERVRHPLLHPVLLSIALLAPLLRVIHLDARTYLSSTSLVSFWLGPAVVALGVTLYRQAPFIASLGWRLGVSLGIGSVVGVVTAAGTAKLLGGTPAVVGSLAPKSVTTPIAMGIAERLGGIPPLTAVLVILVGVLGAVIGPACLRLLRVRSPTAWGLAMGASSHAVGTSRAMEEGELQGATSALAICLNGLLTAVVAPLLMRWLR